MNSSATITERRSAERADVTSSQPKTATGQLQSLIPLFVFLSCLAYLCIPLRYSSLEPDEGIVLQGAERILHGQVPYRDFFTFYTPGSFYLLAFLFRLFGNWFVVARASIAVSGALCSVLTYLLARRVCSRSTSLFMAGLATAVGTGFRFLVLHNWYSTLLACLALYAAVRLAESTNEIWAFATGTLASLTFLFEQSKGACVLLGIGGGFLLLYLGNRTKQLSRRLLVAAAAGITIPILATFAFFAAHHAVGAMLQSWIWPLNHYTQANHVPYGFQNWSDDSRAAIFHSGPLWTRVVKALTVSPNLVIPALPVIPVAFLLYLLRQKWRGKGLFPNATYYTIVSSTLCGLVVSVVIARPDILHFVYLAPVLYIPLGWILQSPNVRIRPLEVMRPYFTLYTALAFGLLALAVLLTATGHQNRVETRRGPIMTRGEDTVIPYIQDHVGAETELLVYPYLPLYNYLTGTVSPDPLDYFQPGMNTQQQSIEILASLKSKPMVPVLFEPWFAEKFANSWPQTPVSAIAKDPVADYVVGNYRVCQILSSPAGWRFHYMVRRDIACP